MRHPFDLALWIVLLLMRSHWNTDRIERLEAQTFELRLQAHRRSF